MSHSVKIEYEINPELVTRAEQELYHILLQQRFAFNSRLYANKTLNNVIALLRLFGLVVTVLMAVLLLLFYGWYTITTSFSKEGAGYTILFIILAFIFYYLPELEKKAKKLSRKLNQRGCKKLAARCVKKAKKLAPYEAIYEIKGDLITYYRAITDDKNLSWELAWSRRLKGVAIHGEYVTAVFNKPSSVQPVIILLHYDFGFFENIFSELHIEVKTHSTIR